MTSPTWVGRRLAGRYVLDERQPEGAARPDSGLAVVFRGRDREGRPVAVTVLHGQLTATEFFRPRFEREARAVAQLRHPAIVPLLDFGLDGETAFLVSDLPAGGSLAARLGGRPLPLPEAARVVAAVGAALGFAYSRGVVHRSLSASQILFDGQGQPVVAGFGLAAIVGDDGQFGDAHYLSPEQVRGQPGDERSDVYSFGVVAFEMATGRQPFEGAALSVMLAQLNEPPPPPLALNPNLPVEWGEALLTALAKEPDARYQHAGELAAALNLPAASPAASPAPTQLEARPPSTRPGSETFVEPPQRAGYGTIVEVPPAPATRPVAPPAAPRPAPRPAPQPTPPPPRQAEPWTPPPASQGRGAGYTPGGPAPGYASLPPEMSLPGPISSAPARRASVTPLIFAGVGGLVLVVLIAAVAIGITLFRGGGAAPQPTEPPAGATAALPSAEGMVQVPAGTYPLGVAEPDPDHAAARTVELPAFWLDRFEVTNAEYSAYVAGHGAAAPYGWQGGQYPAGEDRQPVRGVTFDQAAAYCEAVGKRLPQEAEWEVAARGSDGRLYPWGNDRNAVQFDSAHTYPVGSMAANESPAGVFDLAGNVWEWVAAPYEPIPAGRQILRGGSYNFLQDMAYRLPVDPAVLTAIADAGFRCAASEVR